MANCEKEIIGVKNLTLHYNSNVQITRPNISIEDEVTIASTGINSLTISDKRSQLTWMRESDYSNNYKQNFFDEFTFLAHGIENEVPEILVAIRNNRVGYLAEIITTGGKRYLFQAPIFVNDDNTKQVDSHTWLVTMSYRLPTFLDKLTLLSSSLTNEPEIIETAIEVQGLKSLTFYINKDITITRPDITKENEVEIIAYASGSFLTDSVIEQPKWERSIINSENYKNKFVDTFTFQLNGIENNVPYLLSMIRNNRWGFLAEAKTTSGKTYLFQAPVFVNEKNIKAINSHSWQVSMSYRLPTSLDKVINLGATLLKDGIFILVENDVILWDGESPIVSDKI